LSQVILRLLDWRWFLLMLLLWKVLMVLFGRAKEGAKVRETSGDDGNILRNCLLNLGSLIGWNWLKETLTFHWIWGL
jgi:hypothetical protein